MWWLISLLVLAVIAFFAVKSMQSNLKSGQTENQVDDTTLLSENSENGTTGATENGLSGDLHESSKDSIATESAAAMGTVAGLGAAGVAIASQGSESAETVSSGNPSGIASSGSVGGTGLSTGDTLSDVREMLKILNLDAPDAGRLAISGEQLLALRANKSDEIPDNESLEHIAAKLRQMLA